VYTSERLHDVTVQKATIWIDNIGFFIYLFIYLLQNRREKKQLLLPIVWHKRLWIIWMLG